MAVGTFAGHEYVESAVHMQAFVETGAPIMVVIGERVVDLPTSA